jgi:hypothetical protein
VHGRTVALRREDLADFRSRAPHRLADRLVAEPYAGHRSLVRLSAGDEWAAPTWVPLVQDWLEAGGTGVVVSTRGLLGEGWDAPSLNVVVDLTAAGAPGVATAVRGRVLRRDPDRPEEVVHAWTVTCVADDHPRGGVDHQRALDAAQRRLGLAEDGLVEAGAGHLDPELGPGAGAPGPAVREAVHARALALVAAPERTRRGWAGQGRAPGTTRTVLRVRTGRPLGMPSGVVPPSLLSVTRTLGSPAPAPLPRAPRRVRLWPLPVAAGVVTSATGTVLESAVVGAGGGLATGVVLGGAVAGQRWVAQSRALRRAPADASTAVLAQLAAVSPTPCTRGRRPCRRRRGAVRRPADGEVELRLDTSPTAAALFAACLEELLLPLGEPRWLVSRLVLPPPDGPAAARRLAAARAVGRPVEAAVTWHAVPGWLARTRAGVDAFDTAWRAHVGAGRLVLATDPEGARSSSCCAARTRSRSPRGCAPSGRARDRRPLRHAVRRAAYLMWGLFPLYWPLLEPSGSLEVLAHRVLWSLAVVLVLLAVTRRWAAVRAAVADRRRLLMISLAAVVIAVNWGHLHLRRHERAGRRDLARLLRQPHRHRPARACWSSASGCAGAVGGARRRRGRRARAHRRERPAAVDRAPAGVLVRRLRPAEEDGRRRRRRGARDRDGGAAAGGGAVRRGPRRHRRGDLRQRGPRPRRAAGAVRARHGRAAAGLRRRGVPHPADDARAAAVPRPTIQFLLGITLFGEPLPLLKLVGFVLVWAGLALFTADLVRHHRRTSRPAVPAPA